jgi:hypothetical protein
LTVQQRLADTHHFFWLLLLLLLLLLLSCCCTQGLPSQELLLPVAARFHGWQ